MHHEHTSMKWLCCVTWTGQLYCEDEKTNIRSGHVVVECTQKVGWDNWRVGPKWPSCVACLGPPCSFSFDSGHHVVRWDLFASERQACGRDVSFCKQKARKRWVWCVWMCRGERPSTPLNLCLVDTCLGRRQRKLHLNEMVCMVVIFYYVRFLSILSTPCWFWYISFSFFLTSDIHFVLWFEGHKFFNTLKTHFCFTLQEDMYEVWIIPPS